MSNPIPTVCAILAGGSGRRLGGVDKATLNISGTPLIDLVVKTLRPQSTDLALCLQDQKIWAQEYDLEVLVDRPSAGYGPLGGISAALQWANDHPSEPHWVVTTPVDIPFLPVSLVQNLTKADTDVVIAVSDEQQHFAVAAWRPSLLASLDQTLKAGPIPVHAFQAMHSVSHVTWPVDPVDPFLNINTVEDIKKAEQYLVRHASK